jgi:NAD(P)-dependent dehydrogenase (short-subunit alcohol dehydrogenase family)
VILHPQNATPACHPLIRFPIRCELAFLRVSSPRLEEGIMQDFEGRVAVVTGAASGIGLGLAEQFAGEGMKVVLSDIDAGALDAAVQSLRRREHDVLGVVADVAKAESVEALARKALDAYGKVHLVCNNAGVLNSASTLWDASLRDWQWMFGVNVWGVINGIRTFTPILLDQGEEGWIVNTASIAGLGAGNSIYSITKHAVVAMTEALYLQLKAQDAKVGCSVLCPTWVNTNLKAAEDHRPEELKNPGQSGLATGWDFLWQRLESGVSPQELAVLVADAVRSEQFYIIPDDYNVDAFRDWADNLAQRRSPTPTLRR